MQTATKLDERGQEAETIEAKVPVSPLGAKAANALQKWLERRRGKEEQ